MALAKIADRIIETDVLVVGGGCAGCLVAAKAKEHGLDVTLAEKAHTSRSGSAAAGLDHNTSLPWSITDYKGERITLLDLIRRLESRQMVIQGMGDGVETRTALAWAYLKIELNGPQKSWRSSASR